MPYCLQRMYTYNIYTPQWPVWRISSPGEPPSRPSEWFTNFNFFKNAIKGSQNLYFFKKKKHCNAL